MRPARLAPTLGIVASFAVLALVAAPYAVVRGTGMAVYYAAPVVGPLVVGVFALVTVIVLGSGLKGRTDPQTVAGAALVLGLAMALLTLLWALSVPQGLVGSLTDTSLLQYHRWTLLAATLAVPAFAAWYAKAVL